MDVLERLLRHPPIESAPSKVTELCDTRVHTAEVAVILRHDGP
jgi:hypothetical protein